MVKESYLRFLEQLSGNPQRLRRAPYMRTLADAVPILVGEIQQKVSEQSSQHLSLSRGGNGAGNIPTVDQMERFERLDDKARELRRGCYMQELAASVPLLIKTWRSLSH